MDWNLDALSLSSCKDVEATIASIVQVLSTHQRPHLRVFVMLSQQLSLRIFVVVEIKQIVSSTSLILLSSVEVLNFCL